MMLRARFPEDVICDWFAMLLAGKNPVIVEDARYENGHKVIEDPLDRQAPSQSRRDMAMRTILDRIYGQPVGHTQMQQEIIMHETHLLVNASELASAMSPAALGTLTQLLRSQLPTPVPAMIDVESEDDAG